MGQRKVVFFLVHMVLGIRKGVQFWFKRFIFEPRYTNGFGGLFLLASLFFDTYCYNISQVITLLTYIFSQAFALLCTLKVTYRYSYVTLMTHYYNIGTTTFYSVHESVKGLKM
jgi:hypothetical protein